MSEKSERNVPENVAYWLAFIAAGLACLAVAGAMGAVSIKLMRWALS